MHISRFRELAAVFFYDRHLNFVLAIENATARASVGRFEGAYRMCPWSPGVLEVFRMSAPVIVAVVLAAVLLVAVGFLVVELLRKPGGPARLVAGPQVVGAAALDEVDRALRVLVAACDSAGRALPDVYAVECAADRVVLRLAGFDPEAPAPWEVGGDATEWILSRAGKLAGGQVPADSHPFPLIVSLGLRADRRLLVNLARAAGPISLTGPYETTQTFARTVLSELLSGPVGRAAEVTLTGRAAIQLRDQLWGARPERLRTASTLAEARHSGHQPAARSGSAQVFQLLDDGRAAAEPDQPRRLAVIDAEQFRAEPADSWRGGGAVLVIGDVEQAAWRFEVHPDGRLDTGALGLPVDTVRIG